MLSIRFASISQLFLRCFSLSFRDFILRAFATIFFVSYPSCSKTIECYDKALEIDPKYAKALNNKALALDKLRGTKSEGKDSPDRLCDNDSNNNPHRLPRLVIQ